LAGLFDNFVFEYSLDLAIKEAENPGYFEQKQGNTNQYKRRSNVRGHIVFYIFSH
jgi:hypothetical protein